VSRRTELKRKRILEERERRWKELHVPSHIVPDFGQEPGPCDCGSGEDYDECCKTTVEADKLAITFNSKPYRFGGKDVLGILQRLYENKSVRNPEHIAENFFKAHPDWCIRLTTPANMVRAHRDILAREHNALPPILYHVTHSGDARRILVEGLKPRRLTGRDNYEEQGLSSHPDHVYMTEGNVCFYLSRMGRTAQTSLTVLAIDTSRLDESLLYPDEDYAALCAGHIANGNWHDNSDTYREEITAARDSIENHKHLWGASLRGYGNVAYRGIIPPTALRKATKDFSVSDAFDLIMVGGDYMVAAYPIAKDIADKFRDRLLGKPEEIPENFRLVEQAQQ
jgi:hypothetical protein